MSEQAKQKVQVKESLCGFINLVVICASVAAAYILYFSIHRHVATTAVAVALLMDASYKATKFVMVVK